MAHFAAYNTANGSPVLDHGDEIIIGPLQTAQEAIIAGTIFADQDGIIYIEQSFDGGTHFDLSAKYTITASEGAGFKEDIIAPISQVRFVNGDTKQTVMRLYARCFGTRASGA